MNMADLIHIREELMEQWEAALKLAAVTGYWKDVSACGRVSRFTTRSSSMQREFAEVGAEGITEDAARAWVHGLISAGRTAGTVREIWLSASRRVFSWGREHKRIRHDPFAEVKECPPEGSDSRGWKVFHRRRGAHDPEGQPRVRQTGHAHTENAPLGAVAVCAVKSGKVRVVPLHEHIIAQGFMAMVRQVGKGALFYDDTTPQRVSTDPLKPRRSRADTARASRNVGARAGCR
jgi:hypothetical protein